MNTQKQHFKRLMFALADMNQVLADIRHIGLRDDEIFNGKAFRATSEIGSIIYEILMTYSAATEDDDDLSDIIQSDDLLPDNVNEISEKLWNEYIVPYLPTKIAE